jgi:hypothetical protein
VAAAYINAEGIGDALYSKFISPGAKFADADGLGREIRGSGGARAQELPQGQVEVGVVARAVVVLRERVVRDPPGGIRRRISQDHEQQGPEPRVFQGGRRAQLALEKGGKTVVLELVSETLEHAGAVEHLRTAVLVEFLQALHAPPEREERGDDCPRAGTDNVVEIIGQHERIVGAELALEPSLHLAEHLERDHAADAVSVERQQCVRRCAPVRESHGHLAQGPAATDGGWDIFAVAGACGWPPGAPTKSAAAAIKTTNVQTATPR